jgi:hypothetical protein
MLPNAAEPKPTLRLLRHKLRTAIDAGALALIKDLLEDMGGDGKGLIHETFGGAANHNLYYSNKPVSVSIGNQQAQRQVA